LEAETRLIYIATMHIAMQIVPSCIVIPTRVYAEHSSETQELTVTYLVHTNYSSLQM